MLSIIKLHHVQLNDGKNNLFFKFKVADYMAVKRNFEICETLCRTDPFFFLKFRLYKRQEPMSWNMQLCHGIFTD